MTSPRMEITGERTVPDLPAENYWFRRHQVVYEYVVTLLPAAGLVLEGGCGEGYGAELLRAGGHRVVGLDYEATTVGHVRRRYPDVTVVRGNLVALPFRDGAFDAVVSLQTIEHLWEQPRFLAECLRAAAGGVVALSTPNRLTFPPGNVYHARELDPDELGQLLDRGGGGFEVLGLRHGPALTAWENDHGSLVVQQLRAPVEDWSERLLGQVASITTGDFVLSGEKLDSSLDLIAVRAG